MHSLVYMACLSVKEFLNPRHKICFLLKPIGMQICRTPLRNFQIYPYKIICFEKERKMLVSVYFSSLKFPNITEELSNFGIRLQT